MSTRKQSLLFPMLIASILGVFGSVEFRFVGVLRLDDLIPTACLLFLALTKHFAQAIKNKDVLYPVLTLCGIIVVQLVSDVYNGTERGDIFKGHANFAFGITKFIFFAILFKERLNVVIVYLVARTVGSLIFKDLLQTSDEILSNEYWDLRVGYWAGPLALAFGLLFANRARFLTIAGLFVYGGAAVTLGGRSHGINYLAPAITLCFASPNVRQRLANTSKKHVQRGLIAAGIFAILFFPIYVNLGLQGKITKKAQMQLQELSNPYNPIEVLLAGRKGIQYGFTAVTKRPIAGYGSRAYNGDFVPFQAAYNPFAANTNYIHSMVFECFAFGGLACGFLYCTLMFFTLRRCLNMLALTDYRCVMLAAFIALSFTWGSIGSPLAAFRLVWPHLFAFSFAFNLKSSNETQPMYLRPMYEMQHARPDPFQRHQNG